MNTKLAAKLMSLVEPTGVTLFSPLTATPAFRAIAKQAKEHGILFIASRAGDVVLACRENDPTVTVIVDKNGAVGLTNHTNGQVCLAQAMWIDGDGWARGR